MQIDFTSFRVKKYEKVKGSIYNIIALNTDNVSELLKIGTGNDNDEEVCNFLDELKKSEEIKYTGKRGLQGVLWYLIDILDEEGFFTYLTAQETKSLIQEQLMKMNKQAKMTEEEQQKKMEEAMKKLVEAQKKIPVGTRSGKKSK